MNAFPEVAFGADPGRWPLPTATTPTELWLRAVAAGGQGRYGSALADLESLAVARSGCSLASLGFSTRASFLRQLGWHHAARTWDGRALATAGSDVDAGTDALIGLAADALGVGRFALSDRLLRRAADRLGDASGRLPIRLAWVRAELAMFIGDGTAAVGHAEGAVELAAGWTSARHTTKSQVVLAAALCSAGDVEAARRVAEAAVQATERMGLIPLSWALACLLADIGSSTHSPSEIRAVRDTSAGIVRHRGGAWTAR
jgi:hypothetical protein